MRVLGIDPGTALVGYGLVTNEGGDLVAGRYGVIETPSSLNLPSRLVQVYAELTQLIEQVSPDVVAVEELFFSRNARTAFAVGQGRGVVLLAAAHAGLPVSEYAPPQVKQAVVGYGNASKRQVQEMVRALLNLSEVPRPDDTADALAVAICHQHSARFQQLVEDAG